jgi:hypothetical protein
MINANDYLAGVVLPEQACKSKAFISGFDLAKPDTSPT